MINCTSCAIERWRVSDCSGGSTCRVNHHTQTMIEKDGREQIHRYHRLERRTLTVSTPTTRSPGCNARAPSPVFLHRQPEKALVDDDLAWDLAGVTGADARRYMYYTHARRQKRWM